MPMGRKSDRHDTETVASGKTNRTTKSTATTKTNVSKMLFFRNTTVGDDDPLETLTIAGINDPELRPPSPTESVFMQKVTGLQSAISDTLTVRRKKNAYTVEEAKEREHERQQLMAEHAAFVEEQRMRGINVPDDYYEYLALQEKRAKRMEDALQPVKRAPPEEMPPHMYGMPPHMYGMPYGPPPPMGKPVKPKKQKKMKAQPKRLQDEIAQEKWQDEVQSGRRSPYTWPDPHGPPHGPPHGHPHGPSHGPPHGPPHGPQHGPYGEVDAYGGPRHGPRPGPSPHHRPEHPAYDDYDDFDDYAPHGGRRPSMGYDDRRPAHGRPPAGYMQRPPHPDQRYYDQPPPPRPVADYGDYGERRPRTPVSDHQRGVPPYAASVRPPVDPYYHQPMARSASYHDVHHGPRYY